MGNLFEDMVMEFSAKSLAYWRSYLEIPDLDAADVRSLIDHLEGERGRYERLCLYERGSTRPEIKSIMDIKSFYDMLIEEEARKGKTCQMEGELRKLVSHFAYSNINYIRGFYDSPGLTTEDVFRLIAHFDSESGRYARLCEQERRQQ